MGKSFKKLMPLWVSYIVLFALALLGPLLQGVNGLAHGHWAFLFLLPFAIGAAPFSFIMGEVVQRRSRATSRACVRMALMHTVVVYAIFIVSVFDALLSSSDFLYLGVWLVPAVLSGLFFDFGSRIMRREQGRSDVRYGVEVRRGDPWSSFFDLKWENDSQRRQQGHSGRRPEAVRRAERERSGSMRR